MITLIVTWLNAFTHPGEKFRTWVFVNRSSQCECTIVTCAAPTGSYFVTYLTYTNTSFTGVHLWSRIRRVRDYYMFLHAYGELHAPSPRFTGLISSWYNVYANSWSHKAMLTESAVIIGDWEHRLKSRYWDYNHKCTRLNCFKSVF